MNRRTFLHVSALAAAGLSVVGAEVRRVRVGFLGCSHSHALPKVRLALESADWECAGVCEPAATARAAAEKLGARALTQAQVLAASEVIAVEGEPEERFRMAKAALEAGRHVHLEKGPLVTLAEFRELLGIAQEKKLLLQMGYMWRFNPGINAALEAARQGWLGEVYLVRGVINTNLNAAARQALAATAGGTMHELGCHLVDPLVRLLGKHVQVTPVLRHDAAAADALADNCVAVFDFKRAVGIISSAAMQPLAGPQRSFEIQGTNGVALVKPLEQPVLTMDLAAAAGPYPKGNQVLQFPPYRRYEPEFAELAACVRTGRPLAVTPAEDALVHEAVLKACGMQ
ncbi:hypothetical protein LBMAG56_46070 [Verrucomicrobiota bacterium]|nr:hypothetical protein LBMAG56_46070 [Verrucomicrobiota bacterium]